MSDTRQERIDELVWEALQREPTERAGYLDAECEADLRRDVESLLRAGDTMGEFLEQSAVEVLPGVPEGELFEPGDRVGSYEIVRRIGAGGAGTVYEALQASPHRRVALKVMRAGLASAAALRRFKDEAEILARLSDPCIETVYEAGVHESVPFFAMEFVDGARTLREFAAAENPPVPARLELVARVADAVHHGHQKGIIHRDLKPANVLVDSAGRPKVIDFGIAHFADPHEPGEQARDDRRLLAGTLPYMSPEQCRPDEDDVDTRSDVYAIGVLLYEFLAGRLPHDVADAPITEGTRRIREEPPTPLAVVVPELRGDIALIVHKAMARDRADRYQSAADLARDLRAYLERRPVAARRPNWRYQARLFAARNRALVGSLAALLVVVVGAAIVSTLLAYRAEHARRGAVAARNRERRQSYVANIAAADAAVRVFDLAEARRRLAQAPPDARGWEWWYLAGRLDRSVWTARAGSAQLFYYLASGDGGRRLVTGSVEPESFDSAMTVRDAATGATLVEYDTSETLIRSPVLSEDGAWLAWTEGKGVVALARPDTPNDATRWKAGEEGLSALTFDPQGARIATASIDGRIALWRVPGGELVRIIAEDEGKLQCVAFDPAGRRLATCARAPDVVSIRDLDSGGRIVRLDGYHARCTSLHFSPDGERLVTGARDATARIWDARTGEELRILTRRGEYVSAARFGPDGARVATGHEDGTVTVWDAATGVELDTLWGHTAPVSSVVWGARPGEIHSASLDGSLKSWRTGETRVTRVLGEHEALVRGIAYSPDGSRLACACFDTTVRVYDTGAGGQLAVLEGNEDEVQSVAFVGNGRTLVSGANDMTVRVWDVATGECRLTCRGHEAGVLCVAASPDGSRLASGSNDTTAIVWDAATGAKLHALPHGGWAWSVAFGPDGRTLATASADGDWRLWSVETGELLRRAPSGSAALFGVRFDRAGARLLTVGRDGVVKVWDVATGAELVALRGSSSAKDAAFSPDETQVAVASDRYVRLWDLETAQLILSLRGHRSLVYAVAFHPDGTQIASAGGGWSGEDCTVRLWGRIPGRKWPPSAR